MGDFFGLSTFYVRYSTLFHDSSASPEIPLCLSMLGPTKYVYIKSTTVYVPSSELGLSRPSPNSDDWRKSLALCLLCAGTEPRTVATIYGIDCQTL
jgi:hypothetical protein